MIKKRILKNGCGQIGEGLLQIPAGSFVFHWGEMKKINRHTYVKIELLMPIPSKRKKL